MHEEVPEFYPDDVPMRPPVAWVTWVLVGSTVVVFLLQLLFVHFYGDDVIGTALAFSPDAIAEGRYWTVITYAWAHAVVILGHPGLFWLHIVANMVPLICIGPALERFLGAWRYLGLYVGGALAALLVWFVFSFDAHQSIIGASGAIFALIAAIGTAAPHARVTVYLFYVLPIPMSLRVMALVACGVEVIQLIPLFDWMPGVAHMAHLGGAAFGFLYVTALRRLSRRHSFID